MRTDPTTPSAGPAPATPAAHRGSRDGLRHGLAWTLRAVVGVQTLLVFTQALSAGQFLSGQSAWLAWHEANGTIVLGLTMLTQIVVAAALRWPARGPVWPLLVSLAVFAAEWVQAAAGFIRALQIHIPLGVAIFGTLLVMLVTTGRLTRR